MLSRHSFFIVTSLLGAAVLASVARADVCDPKTFTFELVLVQATVDGQPAPPNSLASGAAECMALETGKGSGAALFKCGGNRWKEGSFVFAAVAP